MTAETKEKPESKLMPGREMDVLVAAKILDWVPFKRPKNAYMSPDGKHVINRGEDNDYLRFSTSDGDAVRFVVPALQKRGWLVVIKAMAEGHYFRTQDIEPITISLPFACETHWQPGAGLENMRRRIHGRQTAFGETMAEAICRAGLLAVEAEKKKF